MRHAMGKSCFAQIHTHLEGEFLAQQAGFLLAVLLVLLAHVDQHADGLLGAARQAARQAPGIVDCVVAEPAAMMGNSVDGR